MNEGIGLEEKISVNKSYDTEVVLEGKKILIKHTWGKHSQDHPPTKLQKFSHLMKQLYKTGVQSWKYDDLIGIRDTAKIGTAQIVIEKWKSDQDKKLDSLIHKGYNYRQIIQKLGRCDLQEISVAHATPITPLNLGLNEGIQKAWDLIIDGTTTSPYDNATAQTGVGDSNAAVAATQTDLQAASNKAYKGMLATFPSRSAQTVTFKSDYISGEAEFAWEEYIVRNGATDLKDLIRALNSQGVKPAAVTWTLQIDISIA